MYKYIYIYIYIYICEHISTHQHVCPHAEYISVCDPLHRHKLKGSKLASVQTASDIGIRRKHPATCAQLLVLCSSDLNWIFHGELKLLNACQAQLLLVQYPIPHRDADFTA
jgi:hypothetical protein